MNTHNSHHQTKKKCILFPELTFILVNAGFVDGDSDGRGIPGKIRFIFDEAYLILHYIAVIIWRIAFWFIERMILRSCGFSAPTTNYRHLLLIFLFHYEDIAKAIVASGIPEVGSKLLNFNHSDLTLLEPFCNQGSVAFLIILVIIY